MSTTPLPNPEDLLVAYRENMKKLKHACKQLVLLDNRMEDLKRRLEWAVTAEDRRFRYSRMLALSSVEGVRNYFYEYSCQKAIELDEMNLQLEEYGLRPLDD